MASTARLVGGFNVLPVKFNATSQAVHYFYCKAHHVRVPHPDKPNERTLLVTNLPPYVDEDCLRRLFGESGTIERVFFHKKPTSDGSPPEDGPKYFADTKPITGFKVAYVVFSTSEEVHDVLARDGAEPAILFGSENPPLVGIKKWAREYNTSFPDPVAMQAEIDVYMTGYDKMIEEKVEKEKAMEGVPDSDGWITVTKHGRRPVISRTEAQNKKIMEKEKKKKGQKELQNFYTFQIRESKMQSIVQLRKKFEDDKQRIALFKASRRFRPY